MVRENSPIRAALMSANQVEVGIPEVHHFGRLYLHNILVIDLLGKSLEDLLQQRGRGFSVKTVAMIAIQLVSSVSAI